MMMSGVIPVTELDVVQRQAETSTIIHNATLIRKGRGDAKLKVAEDFTYYELKETEAIANEAKRLYLEKAKLYGYDEVVILTPYRQKTLTGSNELNLAVRNAINPASREYNKMSAFYKGDKVMFTKNENGLANGDEGYVTSTGLSDSGEITVTVKFDSGFHSFSGREEISKLILAYALSIHKSQGSEYTCVILICDPVHERMLKQNLLYTAVTRAKKEFILIGDARTFGRGMTVKDVVNRNTRLSNRIKIAAERHAV
jgi:exodeoxyribonuclease V alpha subunit